MLMCSVAVYAEDHIHDWSSWDYTSLNSNHHVKQRYCYDCNKEENIQEPHNLMTYPSGYSYGGDDICYAEYRCKDCGDYIKKPTSHNWQEMPHTIYEQSDATYHIKSTDYKCSQCDSTHYFDTKEKHKIAYRKNMNNKTYAICETCYYTPNKTIANKTIKKSLKKKKKYTITVSVLKDDGIKKIKLKSGSKNITIKKKSNKKLEIKCKKKGNAKFTVKTKSGVTYTYKVNIK